MEESTICEYDIFWSDYEIFYSSMTQYEIHKYAN